MKKNQIEILVLCILTSLLFACGGGGGSTQTSSTSSGTHVLTSSNLALSTSDTGSISTAVNSLHLSPGNSSSLKITANGVSQQQYLSTLACKDSVCSDLVKFSTISANTVTVTVSVPKTYKAGTYTIPIYASSAANASIVSVLHVYIGTNSMLKVSYIDITASGSLASITAGGYAASNVLVYAFAPVNTSSINSDYLTAIQGAISKQGQGTVNLLSIGGQNGTASAMSDTATVVKNITAQIAAYNSQLRNGRIDGVDLDLENNFTSDQILALAKGFKAAGLLVSTAPQVYYSTGSNVDPENPTNLILTSGGSSSINQNVYGAAIAGGYVDYIMAQTYNTSGWTVGNYNESQPEFFSAIARALNVTVKSSCSGVSTLCIPTGTKIVIGQPANAGSGGFTIFNPTAASPIPSYNQAAILTSLNSQISTVLQDSTKYGAISGVMMWALNNDYSPQSFGDGYAASGGFSSAIYGAPTPPPLPYFILQVSNTGPNAPGQGAYAAATLVVDSKYWIFGNKYSAPITPGLYQQWGTQPSASNPATPNVVDSGNLDSIFAGGNTSFVAQQIIIDGYSSQGSLNSPTVQYACPQGTNYTFQAGKSYNLMVNAASGVCEISVQ